MAGPQSKRLTGINPLAYLGVEATTPPQMIISNVAPLPSDSEGFNIGTFWLDTVSQDMFVLVSLNAGVAVWSNISGSAGTITGLRTDDANIALPSAGIINVFGGANINTYSSGSTVDVALNDSIILPATTSNFLSGAISIGGSVFINALGTNNSYLGGSAGIATTSGTGNTGLGYHALILLTTSSQNTAVGAFALDAITTGSANTGSVAVGYQALSNSAGGDANNVAVGRVSGLNLVGGSGNVLVGDSSGFSLSGGGANNTAVGFSAFSNAVGPSSYNTLVGYSAGSNYTTTESSNIALGANVGGVVGESNTIRIGLYGTGSGEQNQVRIAACYSNFGTRNTFVGEQTGNTTLTGTDNSLVGYQSGNQISSGVQNVSLGSQSLGTGAGSATTGTGNAAIGFAALNDLVSGSYNVAVGTSALSAVTTSTRNIAIGAFALDALTTGATINTGSVAVGHASLSLSSGTDVNNVAVGRLAGNVLNGGSANVFVGDSAAGVLTQGSHNTIVGPYAYTAAVGPASYNILIGASAGSNYTTTESSNIIIGAGLGGIVGENNVIRIGLYGTSSGQQNQVRIAACYSNYGTRNTFVGELAGNTTLTTGSAIDNVFLGHNAGNATTTASQVTALGSGALASNDTAGANTAVGYEALTNYTGLNNNTAVGSQALTTLVSGSFNTAVGKAALFACTANRNTAVGNSAGIAIQGGSSNVIVGESAAFNLTGAANFNTVVGAAALSNATGDASSNIVIGAASGSNYATTESNNILINAAGVASETRTMRIGFGTTDMLSQTSVFVNGIYGVTTSGSATAVLIDATGNLGTVSSSRRGKENIEDMNEASDFINQLRPVTFNYISDKKKERQYGLIAEEVLEVNPRLVVFGENGQVESVKYHELPVLLLNELQQVGRHIESLHSQILALEARIEELERL